jgi:hypothetical protein
MRIDKSAKPAFRLVPTADKEGLPPPKSVMAIEAFQDDNGYFEIDLVGVDGDSETLGTFPEWSAVLGTAKDHVAKSQWAHWMTE